MSALGHGGFRLQLTLLHFSAAAELAQRVSAIESDNAGQPFGPFWDSIVRNAIASVMTMVAGLESYVNELIADRHQIFPGLDAKLLDELWLSYEWKPLLFRYQALLRLRTGNDNGIFARRPGQDINALLKLRGGLVHFKPQWSYESGAHDEIADLLVVGKFEPSPWFSGEPLFPRAWATSSCLRWAAEACTLFLEEIEVLAQLPTRHPVRSMLLAPLQLSKVGSGA